MTQTPEQIGTHFETEQVSGLLDPNTLMTVVASFRGIPEAIAPDVHSHTDIQSYLEGFSGSPEHKAALFVVKRYLWGRKESTTTTVAGFATVSANHETQKDVAWLHDVAVQGRYRGQGIGRLLVESCTDWARDSGAAHIAFAHQTTEDADSGIFLQRSGFTVSSGKYPVKPLN